MSWHKAITIDTLQRAREKNFDGFRRLANFVNAKSYDPYVVLVALQKHLSSKK